LNDPKIEALFSEGKGVYLHYDVEERMLYFSNLETKEEGRYKMNAGSGDYRSGKLSTSKYPDMTNDPSYEGFKALGQQGPGGPLPRMHYRVTNHWSKKGGFKTFGLYPKDYKPTDMDVKIKNPITGKMNTRSTFLIHMGTPGGVGCIVCSPRNRSSYADFVSKMNRVKTSSWNSKKFYGTLVVE